MKKEKTILFMIILFTLLFQVPLASETFTYDFYTKEQREEKIASKILKCKNVVYVAVNDDNEESACADIVVTLINNRTIHIKYVDLKLKGYNSCVIRIGDICPVKWGYESRKSSSTSWYFSLGVELVSFSDLKYLMKKNNWNICDLINNYDEVYDYIKELPYLDKNIQYDYFEIKKGTQGNTICSIWEDYENPFFKKGSDKNKTPYGYKFFIKNENEFIEIPEE